MDFATAAAVVAAIVGVIALMTTEIVRRSDLRQLEQLVDVVGTVSCGSVHRQELQNTIDHLALRISVLRRRPKFSLLRLLTQILGIATAGALVAVVTEIILIAIQFDGGEPSLTVPLILFSILYVITGALIIFRNALRASWYDREYREISGESKTPTTLKSVLTD